MLPITCKSVLLLLLFCYETVKCAGVSRQYGKKASRTVKLNTNFNSMSDQTRGKNVPIVHNCKVRDLKETKKIPSSVFAETVPPGGKEGAVTAYGLDLNSRIIHL